MYRQIIREYRVSYFEIMNYTYLHKKHHTKTFNCVRRSNDVLRGIYTWALFQLHKVP